MRTFRHLKRLRLTLRRNVAFRQNIEQKFSSRDVLPRFFFVLIVCYFAFSVNFAFGVNLTTRIQVIPDVRVVAFATPACADIGVSKLCEGICTSVVLHDDVVPRVTPQAVRALLKDALCTKVKLDVIDLGKKWARGPGRAGVHERTVTHRTVQCTLSHRLPIWGIAYCKDNRLLALEHFKCLVGEEEGEAGSGGGVTLRHSLLQSFATELGTALTREEGGGLHAMKGTVPSLSRYMYFIISSCCTLPTATPVKLLGRSIVSLLTTR